MSKEKRYLIATADERTWKFDRPVVFLGEWCRLYDRKHVWESMDAVVAEPYGLGLFNKDADYAEARQLENELFPLLCSVLNHHHKTQHGERFWKILLGHWFRRYIDVLLNRFKTLQACMDSYDISGVTVYENDKYSLAPLDSYSSIWAFNDDRWNDALISQMLIILGNTDFPVEFVRGPMLEGFRFNAQSSSLKKTFLKWGYRQLSKTVSLFVKKKDAFIINSYLPTKESIKLQLILGQFPQFYSSPKFQVAKKPNLITRQALSKNIINSSASPLYVFLTTMLFQLLPVCYLEALEDLEDLVKKQPWPKQPKFIFTSNSFDTDEVFKLWAASKAELNYKYFTGQHGNNYGTYRYMNPSIEEITADNFLTWGWTNRQLKYVPAFNFKTAGVKKFRYNSKGGLLLIEVCLNHRVTTWDNHAEYVNYFEEQQKFICNLDDSLRHELTIRLHSEYKRHVWSEVERWHDFNPDLKIDTGDLYIRDLIAQNRIVVHSYDSTGILETLSQNIPTIAFWQNGLDHLRDSVKPHYQLLIDVGIIHLDSISAAKKVNEIWNNIDEWWLSAKVQKARKFFCKNYARASNKPISDLKAIFEEAINLQKG